jgi:hypothetical protein
MAKSPVPERQPAPPRFDPWAPNASRTASWLALSTAVHIGLLFLFATVTLTVIKKIDEIRVKVVDDAMIGEENLDGADSLRDLAGALKPEAAAPQRAAPSGPAIQGVRAPELPRVGGFGPKIGGPQIDINSPISFGAGGGGLGGVGGLGGSFGDYVGGLRKVGLDVALVIDTTESMQFVIDDVRAKLTSMVGMLHRMVPTARVGIVVYRDKGDDYVVKWSDLSFNTQKLLDFLSTITADGGGDWEEAIHDALEAAFQELNWRKNSKKVVILVGNSPPHPWEVDGVHRIVREFRKQGGFVSTIDVTQRAHDIWDQQMWRSLHGKKPYEPSPMPEFYKEVAKSYGEIAKLGGGEMILLGQGKVLVRSIVELTFGSRWKTEMAKFLQELS